MMLRIRWLPAAAVGLGLLAPISAAAAPPPNDNYLSSLTINQPDGSLPREFGDSVDTTEATTQPDTFDPSREGLPFGGGKPEPTSCADGALFGKTVWYDFAPPVPGGVEIVATGFDAVVAVYEWDRLTSQLGRTVECQNDSSGQTETVRLQHELRAPGNYTVQVGGVNGAGGPLDFGFSYFRDRDGDGIFDEEPDKCLSRPGIAAFGGCPPVVRGGPRIAYDRVGGGIRVTSLFVDRAAKHNRIQARCRSCGKSVTVRARRAGTVRLSGFSGRIVRAGDRIQIRITHPRSRSGRYRFGAIGKVFTWPVLGNALGPRTERCTAPGSHKPIHCP